MRLTIPPSAEGPYSAVVGPLITSTRSMSSADTCANPNPPNWAPNSGRPSTST